MNLKIFGSKVKGFTLLELLVVIAIIAILAGILSTAVSGFMRDAKLETNNNKAQMIYTGFQNILINSEINQDDSLFDINDNTSFSGDDPLKQVVFCFGMSDSKVNDDMYIEVTWQGVVGGGHGPISSTNWSDWYKKLEKEILSQLDNSFEGTAVVYMDYENYVVDSVICFAPGSKSVDDLKSDLINAGNIEGISDCVSFYETSGGNGVQMIDSLNAQVEYYKNVGPNLGAYPFADSFASGSAPTKITS